jgi:hypothetical protein
MQKTLLLIAPFAEAIKIKLSRGGKESSSQTKKAKRELDRRHDNFIIRSLGLRIWQETGNHR